MQKTPSGPNPNSEYAQYQFTLFCRYAISVPNLRIFVAYNLQAKKCGGVQKMTMQSIDTNHEKMHLLCSNILKWSLKVWKWKFESECLKVKVWKWNCESESVSGSVKVRSVLLDHVSLGRSWCGRSRKPSGSPPLDQTLRKPHHCHQLECSLSWSISLE